MNRVVALLCLASLVGVSAGCSSTTHYVSPTPPKPYNSPEVQWDRVKGKWYCTAPSMGSSCPHSNLH